MNKTTSSGTKVSQTVLVERINKRLKTQSRDREESRMTGSPSIGHFYENINSISEGKIDLESIGRKLGVLMPGETVSRSE